MLYKYNYRLPADDKELKSSRPEFFQKVAFHLAFAATVRIGELLGLTWDCVDISEEAISENRAYVFINKQVERVSKEAVEELDSKEVILIFPSQRKNNKTVRVLKTPKTDTSERKVYIPGFVAQCLIDIKKEQDEVKEALGSEYTDYNLIMATTFGMPINSSYIRDQLQKVIDREGLPDVVFHSLRHTSVTYKLNEQKEEENAISAIYIETGEFLKTGVFVDLNNGTIFSADIPAEGIYNKKGKLISDDVLENGDKVKIYGDGIMLESFPGQYPGVTKIQRTGRASLEETQEYEDQVTGMMKPVAVQ